MTKLTGPEIEARLLAGWPGVGWSMLGESVKGLVWPEGAGPKPTMKEIRAVVLPPPPYREARAKAYREIGDLGDMLDTIFKELRARGEPATAEYGALVEKIDEIKARIPKS